MKSLTLKAPQCPLHRSRQVLDATAGSVNGVPGDGMAYVMHVNPNLVRAAGLESHPKPSKVRIARAHLKVRDRVTALPCYRHAGAMVPMTRDGGIDSSALGAQASPDYRVVLALDGPAQHLGHEMSVGAEAAGHDEEARSVLVETMHDARSRQSGELGVAMQESVGEGMGSISCSRMHDQARPLVDHDQLRVFVYQPECNRIRFPGVAVGGGRHLQLHSLSSGDAHCGVGNASVDAHPSFPNRMLNSGAGTVAEDFRKGSIEAKPGEMSGENRTESFARHFEN